MTDFLVKIAPSMNAPPQEFKVCQAKYVVKGGTPPFVYLDNWFNSLLPPVAAPTFPVPPEFYAASEWLDYFIVRVAAEITVAAEEFVICRSLATVATGTPTFGFLDNLFKQNEPSPIPALPLPLVSAIDWDFAQMGIELDGNIK